MKFLHLEDNDCDAELFRTLLVDEWPDCEIMRLSSRKDFETAIRAGDFDLILSDHSMPGFDGLTALEMARTTCPGTPFVFLSGTIGEGRAIEALKHGAVDYVLKDAPARFLSAVRNALTHAQQEAAQRHAEESLRQSQEQFQQIAENIDDFVVLLDSQGHCLYANPTFRQLIHRPEYSLRLNILEDIHPNDRKRFREFLVNATQSGAARDIEYRILLPDNVVRHLEARISLLRYSSNEVPILLLAGRNVTERRQAEELLRERASLLEKAHDAICVFNLRFAITLWNASAERTFGWAAAEALGQNFRELLFGANPSQFDTIFALTLAEGEWQGEFHATRPDGRRLTVDSSWTLVTDDAGQTKSILCINTDVTQRKQLEQELQRTQRMESLGMLAGGIAHDLNNMLSPILLSVGLLRPLAKGSECKEILETLETSATNGSELVRQILLFARGGEGRRTEVKMGEFLSGLKGFLKAALRRGIELYTDYQADIWPISADATQLKQVLLNLCVNARDAMPLGGSVRITARNLNAPPAGEKAAHGTIPTGACVRLSVADTGTGIAPQILDKIFDPFFTTKELGKGTGLGLSTILGVVRGHDGAIQVESSPGAGTTFHIYFPALFAPRAPVVEPPLEPLRRGAGELILVIDDDDGIRLVTERILASEGFEVITAHDGESGLELFHRERERVQLVICDQMMPGLSGAAVLAQIHRDDAEVKLIAMSGLSQGPVFPGADERVVFLPKPISADTLLRAVRRTLDAAPHN
jgi:PAS domain S-box-containing protein